MPDMITHAVVEAVEVTQQPLDPLSFM